MDHTFYSISSSYVNRSGTSTFSDSNQICSYFLKYMSFVFVFDKFFFCFYLLIFEIFLLQIFTIIFCQFDVDISIKLLTCYHINCYISSEDEFIRYKCKKLQGVIIRGNIIHDMLMCQFNGHIYTKLIKANTSRIYNKNFQISKNKNKENFDKKKQMQNSNIRKTNIFQR